MEKHLILGVHITDRVEHAVEVQNILTKFGGCIRTRLGLHDVTSQGGSPNGVLILECIGKETVFNDLADALSKIPGLEVKKMVFDHP